MVIFWKLEKHSPRSNLMKPHALNSSDSSCQIDNRWLNIFQKMLRRIVSKQESSGLWDKYQNVFSANYQSLMPPRYAVSDEKYSMLSFFSKFLVDNS